MRSWLSVASRLGLAVGLGLLTLSFLRWAPVYCETPVDLRALSLVPPTLLLAIVAALTGKERPRKSNRGLGWALLLTLLALGALVGLRPKAGLRAEVFSTGARLGSLPPGPIDLVADDLASLPRTRRERVSWSGALRAPRTGVYRFWVAGEGSVLMRIDRENLIEAAGSPLRGEARTLLRAGEHTVDVEHQWVGPPVHFRVGWTEPGSFSHPELIPSRFLGPSIPGVFFLLTDVLSFALALLVGILAFSSPWDVPRRLGEAGLETSEIVLALGGLLVVVLGMSFPLVRDLSGTGPVDRVDGRLNAWILAWDAHVVFKHPFQLFQAPIFHPLPDTLAFSENLLLPGIVAAPAIFLSGPVLGYNVALLSSLVVSGLGAYLLIRRVSSDRVAAFVGGALFAAGSHRWFRLAHLHAQMTPFLPLALLALDRFWERRTWRRAAWVGALLVLQGMSSVYLGVVTATVLGISVFLAIVSGLSRKESLSLVLALAIGTALLVPLIWPYTRMRSFEGREFSLEEISHSATTPESYAASATRLYGPLTERHADDAKTREPLFPGVVPLVFGLGGLAVAPRRYRYIGLSISAVAFLLSLGPATPVFRFLHENLFVFRGLRALNRFSLVIVLALSVFSGLALSGRRRLCVLALAFGLVEAANVPLSYGELSPPSATARFLSRREGAIAYLPLGERDTEVMLESVVHFRPLMNGDSGFVPRSYAREKQLLDRGLGEEALRLLRGIDVKEVVARAELPLPLEAQFGDERVYSVPEGSRAEPVPPGLTLPSLWGPTGPTVDLGHPQTVGRVVFEVGDGAWEDAPRIFFSKDGRRWEESRGTASLADAILGLTRNPVHPLAEVTFPARETRFVRLDSHLPVASELLAVGP